MDTARDDILVLRRAPSGEANWVITALGRERGVIAAMARGARRSKRRFQAGLGPFFLFSAGLVRRPGRNLWELGEVDCRRSFAAIAGDVAAMAHGSYGTELVRELLPPEKPEPAAFDLLIELYQSLEAEGPAPAALRAFELKLLRALGLAPALTWCALCGADLPLERGDDTVFSPREGGALCLSCGGREAASRHLEPGARGLLVAAAALPLAGAARDLAGADPAAARRARDAMVAIVLYHVGKPLRSLDFIARLRGGAHGATYGGET